MKRDIFSSLTKIVVSFALLCILIFGIFVPHVSARTLSGPPNPNKKLIASAATAPCWGSNCYNKDPYALGCNASIHEISTNIVTWDTHTVIGIVWNAYSYTCNANWAEAEINYSVNPHNYPYTVQIINQNSPAQKQCYPASCAMFAGGYHGNGIVAWTNMVDGTHQATASVYSNCADCDVNYYIGSISQ